MFDAFREEATSNFRVIDLQLRCVRRVPLDVRYITLSYVWGRVPMYRMQRDNFADLNREGGLDAARLLLPKTINDAIDLVEAIDERYLWVDGLCLMQDDEDDVALGIEMMNTIYEDSYFTIVAGSGSDANAVLPGMPQSPRIEKHKQLVAEIAPGLFMSAIRSIDWHLQVSAYNTRGWRFQEIVLPRHTVSLATELVSLQPSRGEVLLFRRRRRSIKPIRRDLESQSGTAKRESSTMPINNGHLEDPLHTREDGATFVWSNLCFEIKEGKKQKEILVDVEGWVKPRTMTALMGPSGAGKTSLLNALADRVSVGVVSGEKHVDARFQDVAFARKVGYARQEDLHLESQTVREALEFSALLRQAPRYSRLEKLNYVNHVIDLLDLGRDGLTDAVIGIPGEGLNVEQRKRVTIGVELAARPDLLLFLDEPTSGLDSESAVSICRLLRKLADDGKAILCTIHQPLSEMMAYFDRLLLLEEGHVIYFGELGQNFSTLTGYFEEHGAKQCGPSENAAAWMLEVLRDRTDQSEKKCWADLWKSSRQRVAVKEECERMRLELAEQIDQDQTDVQSGGRFATSTLFQLYLVTWRTMKHAWYSPIDFWFMALTTFGMSFINGESFWNSGNTPQDLQNQIFFVFILTTMFGSHIQLIMARFHAARVLFEARESHSRTYSWLVFIISNFTVEFLSQTVMAAIAFVSWYYPIGLWRDAAAVGQQHQRGGLTFLLIWALLVLFQTLSHLLMTVIPDIATGLPRFWIFMYRATPLSYFISASMATGPAGFHVTCEPKHVVRFNPRNGETCATYLAPYLASAGGQLVHPDATADCGFCAYNQTDELLGFFGIFWDQRWRNWGVLVCFNVMNVGLALAVCGAARGRSREKKKKKERKKGREDA